METYKYRIHSDHRRSGKYDLFPALPGDVNITKHASHVRPEELHMHKHQTDYFAVVEGRVLFRLLYDDGRPSEMEVVSAEDGKVVVIPPGVWHGYMAIEPAMMVFYITHKYDQTDEFRRTIDLSDWDHPSWKKI